MLSRTMVSIALSSGSPEQALSKIDSNAITTNFFITNQALTGFAQFQVLAAPWPTSYPSTAGKTARIALDP